MNPRPHGITRQGHYAGAVSRLLAFGTDIGFAWLVLLVILAGISAAVSLIVGHAVQLRSFHLVGVAMLVAWYPLYFAYQWALSGKTFGMALFGLRVVTAEGRAIEPRHAIARTMVLPFSIAIFGLGLFGIVLRVDHRGWHDRLAKTCVVYDWDARAARLRWLARKHDLPASRTPASQD